MKNSFTRSIYRFLCMVLFCFSVGFGSAQPKSDSVRFRKITLTKDFISEGVAVGDVNHDGKMDVMAGSFWFESPHWTRHAITSPKTFFPDTAFSNSFLDFSMDVNQDGWIDLIRVGFPGEEVVWYENPKNAKGYWKEHLIYRHIGNESPALVDVDGDGRPDILCNDPVKKEMIWIKSPAQKGDTLWKRYTISRDPNLATNRYTHGLGFGDMNMDGRKDVDHHEGLVGSAKGSNTNRLDFSSGRSGTGCCTDLCDRYRRRRGHGPDQFIRSRLRNLVV